MRTHFKFILSRDQMLQMLDSRVRSSSPPLAQFTCRSHILRPVALTLSRRNKQHLAPFFRPASLGIPAYRSGRSQRGRVASCIVVAGRIQALRAGRRVVILHGVRLDPARKFRPPARCQGGTVRYGDEGRLTFCPSRAALAWCIDMILCRKAICGESAWDIHYGLVAPLQPTSRSRRLTCSL